MDNLCNIKEELHNDDYNAEPVVYCKNCLSLKIMILDENTDYCDKCGNTDLGTAVIESWEKMYEKKYGKPLIQNKNGREESSINKGR